MLSDKEKKAIKFLEKLKDLKIILSCSFWNNGEFEFNNIQKEQFDIILGLIEKQSKEIEEYKKQLDLDYVDKHFVPIERYNQLEKEIEELKDKNKSIVYNYEMVVDKLENSTPNDKIKAKIEEYKELLYSYEKDLEEKLHYVDKGSMNCIIAQIQVLQSLLEKE